MSFVSILAHVMFLCVEVNQFLLLQFLIVPQTRSCMFNFEHSDLIRLDLLRLAKI